MEACEKCVHKPVCGKYVATGGHVRECEHFKDDRLQECLWCDPGNELCGTCKKFFDYYGDGVDKCYACFDDEKCAIYEPIGYCPRCGRDMRGEGDGNHLL